jgi:hypothetical protein
MKMSKLTLTLAVAGYILGAAGPLSGIAQATDGRMLTPQATVISAQEDCKEGETWNEETQKCDVKEG